MESKLENSRKIKDFTKSCLLNWNFPECKNMALEIWKCAKNFEEFKKDFLAQENLRKYQGYWVFAKDVLSSWEYRYKLISYFQELGGEYFKTVSDCGSVKIGNQNFNINISNKYGDGETNVVVLEKNVSINGLDFVTNCNGNFNIYLYDCSKNDVVYNCSGEYGIYNFEKLVVFVKWN